MQTYDIVIVGGGLFGLTAALALQGRGHGTAVLDPGPVPHPLAASTDISKVVRMEYGPDETYMALVEAARDGWLAWNTRFGEMLYHETGVMMVTRRPMRSGDFEYESYQLLQKRGHRPERLDAKTIVARFPAWRRGQYVDGFFHVKGGYVESGRVITALSEAFRARGGTLHLGQTAATLTETNGRVNGVKTKEGDQFHSDLVIVAAGTWTQQLVSDLAPVMKSIGQPVFHLRPSDPGLFLSPQFPVFTADIARSGWYGFPLHPQHKVVKIANHGAGQTLDPESDERLVGKSDRQRLQSFLANTFAGLADASIVHTRLCLYSDTMDEHFLIDHHPAKPGLVVAAGGSGHAFKFGPILGDLIADVVERRPNAFAHKFRWRALNADTVGEEAARFRGTKT